MSDSAAPHESRACALQSSRGTDHVVLSEGAGLLHRRHLVAVA